MALLKKRAPAPDWQKQLKDRGVKSSLSYDSFNPPPDNASLNTLIEFWSKRYIVIKAKPSNKVKRKLLKAAVIQPYYASSVLKYFIKDKNTFRVVKKIFERNKGKFTKSWSKSIKDYLMTNSSYYRSQLIYNTKYKVKYEGNYIDGEEYLKSLAKLDYKKAKPILNYHLKKSHRAIQVLILTIEYHRALKNNHKSDITRLRSTLKRIVRSKKENPYGRDIALSSVMKTQWFGTEKWFLSLYSDESLMPLKIGEGLVSHALTQVVKKKPDKWIPQIVKLVNHKNYTIHSNAVITLAEFNLDKARKDALTPLIPWIGNKNWASTESNYLPRLRLLQSLDKFKLPLEVKDLRKVVRFEKGFFRRAAAEALVYYKDTNGVGALKAGYKKEKDDHHKRLLLGCILQLKGFKDFEIARGILSYLKDKIQKKTKHDDSAFIGYVIYQFNWSIPDNVVLRLIEKYNNIENKKSVFAKYLNNFIFSKKNKPVYNMVLNDLERGTITENHILLSLSARTTFKKLYADRIRKIYNQCGIYKGISAIILNEKKYYNTILKGSDHSAISMLLATGRLIRQSYAIGLVIPHLNQKNILLSKSAELYLISEDSPKARKSLYNYYNEKLVILGARMSFDPGHFSNSKFNVWEDKLLSIMSQGDNFHSVLSLKEKPVEIYALLSAGYWGNGGQIIFCKYKSHIKLIFYDKRQKRMVKVLKKDSIEKLISFIKKEKIIDLAPYNVMIFDGIQFEFIYLNRKGGRRVFMNNPRAGIYGKIVSEFYKYKDQYMVK